MYIVGMDKSNPLLTLELLYQSPKVNSKINTIHTAHTSGGLVGREGVVSLAASPVRGTGPDTTESALLGVSICISPSSLSRLLGASSSSWLLLNSTGTASSRALLLWVGKVRAYGEAEDRQSAPSLLKNPGPYLESGRTEYQKQS